MATRFALWEQDLSSTPIHTEIESIYKWVNFLKNINERIPNELVSHMDTTINLTLSLK